MTTMTPPTAKDAEIARLETHNEHWAERYAELEEKFEAFKATVRGSPRRVYARHKATGELNSSAARAYSEPEIWEEVEALIVPVEVLEDQYK